MIVAMPVVGMMQVTIDQVVQMVAMRHSGVPAIRSMHVVCIVTRTVMRYTALWIGSRYFDYVLIVMVFVGTVQMAIVQIAGVISVLHRNVPAFRAVFVRVVFVDVVGHQLIFLVFM